MGVVRRGAANRFIRSERRRQLWRKHTRMVVDRRNKWFYLNETCGLNPLPENCADPECEDGDFE
ncbi:MAG: hypothetical protein LAT77_10200 [Aliidiomarina sp.]|uniref:hypothetical protein n=1 Tax=Aliidiomarina sp. TaxID=1872439 RepID=UPI0025B7AEAC|nr:hypothetical protein [Aliidiomarina sp.]MCH8502265.1 hypothetical protein [Aliidiomarina sp.]